MDGTLFHRRFAPSNAGILITDTLLGRPGTLRLVGQIFLAAPTDTTAKYGRT